MESTRLLHHGLLSRRLRNQKLTGRGFSNAGDVVRWLGAVQSQDYVGAKWAIGLRARCLDGGDVDRAYNDGEILRTHVLRPTWHFVPRADIRWMLALTGPRLQLFTRRTGLQVGLTDSDFTKCRGVVERVLAAGPRTRKEIASALRAARIDPTGLRLGLLLIDLEAQAVICSGPLSDRQFTYSLVSARAPSARVLTREEALAELARRFFQSHGPATLKDFAWWSGLTMRDAKAATTMVDCDLLSVPPELDISGGATYLLPNYDEYLIAYKDRGAVIDPKHGPAARVFTNAEYPHQVVVDGRVAGSWRRRIAESLVVTVRPYGKLTKAKRQAIVDQAARHGTFLGLNAEVRFDR